MSWIKIARGSPFIIHLFFIDDNLIFFKANPENCITIKDSLHNLEIALGQQINFDKSAITFSNNTPHNHILFIKNNLQLTVCQAHDLYLGLFTFSIRSKRI